MCWHFWRETPSRYTSVFHQPASKTAQTTHPLVTWALTWLDERQQFSWRIPLELRSQLVRDFQWHWKWSIDKINYPIVSICEPGKIPTKFMLHLQLKNQPYQSYRKSNVNKWFENWKNLHSLYRIETSWSPCDRGLVNPFENENRNSQSISQTFKFVFPTANRRRHFPHILSPEKKKRASISTLCDSKKWCIHWLHWVHVLLAESHTNFDISSDDHHRKMETWEGADGESDICHHSRRCNSLCLPFPSDFQAGETPASAAGWLPDALT